MYYTVNYYYSETIEKAAGKNLINELPATTGL